MLMDFREQCWELRDAGTYVQTPPASGQFLHERLRNSGSESSARLPLRFPEFITAFVTIDGLEPFVIEMVKHVDDGPTS